MLNTGEDSFRGFLWTVPLGFNYMRLREELVAEAQGRQRALEQNIAPEPTTENEPAVEPSNQSLEPATLAREEPLPAPVAERPVKTRADRSTCNTGGVASQARSYIVEREHRRLQHLVKRLGRAERLQSDY